MIADWQKLYDPNKWIFRDGTWTYTQGYYAREAFEQGTFSMHILPKYKHHIKKVDWNIFCRTQGADIPHKVRNVSTSLSPIMERT